MFVLVLYQFCAEEDLGEASALTGDAQHSWPAVRPAAICLTDLPALPCAPAQWSPARPCKATALCSTCSCQSIRALSRLWAGSISKGSVSQHTCHSDAVLHFRNPSHLGRFVQAAFLRDASGRADQVQCLHGCWSWRHVAINLASL